MPSLKVHLETGKRIASKLNFSPQEELELLVGCILPDVNNGFINSPKTKYSHDYTHYSYNGESASARNFYNSYTEKIKAREPIFLGYLLHLFVDVYFNQHFYQEFRKSPMSQGLNKDQQCSIKHHDFWIYDTNFTSPLDLTPEIIEAIVPVSNQIANVQIVPEDMVEINELLHNSDINKRIVGGPVDGEPYTFCDQAFMDRLLEGSIEEFTDQYLKGEDTNA